MNLLVAELNALLSDLYAHEYLEGSPVECKGTTGSWFDVADRVNNIREIAEEL